MRSVNLEAEKRISRFLFFIFIIIIGSLVFCSGGCSVYDAYVTNNPVTKSIFAMDTYMTITAYGKNAEAAIDECISEITRLDNLLDAHDSSSEIYKINHVSEGHINDMSKADNPNLSGDRSETSDYGSDSSEYYQTEISDDICRLWEYSDVVYDSTNGAFDVTIYPIVMEWGFPDRSFNVPDNKTIEALLEKTGTGLIDYDAGQKKLSVPYGMGIDFGAIAKGYAAMQVSEILKAHDIESALINLGGNVALIGSKPDGSDYRVAIKNPFLSGSDAPKKAAISTPYIAALNLSDTSVVTSGGYERYFEENNTIYHHIIDPHTGYPAMNGLASVTIICDNRILADAYSTALFVMGEERAVSYWKSIMNSADKGAFKNKSADSAANNSISAGNTNPTSGGDNIMEEIIRNTPFEMVLVADDGRILATPSIAEKMESDEAVEIIKYK